jgi:hypothetical protein
MSQCLKCGKKTEDRSVFCNECLAIMEQYPVKPGTVVHIPRRHTLPVSATKVDYEESRLSEQVAQQRGLIRWLTSIIAGLSILLVITAVLLLHTLTPEQQVPAIGRNYTTNTVADKP